MLPLATTEREQDSCLAFSKDCFKLKNRTKYGGWVKIPICLSASQPDVAGVCNQLNPSSDWLSDHHIIRERKLIYKKKTETRPSQVTAESKCYCVYTVPYARAISFRVHCSFSSWHDHRTIIHCWHWLVFKCLNHWIRMYALLRHSRPKYWPSGGLC